MNPEVVDQSTVAIHNTTDNFQNYYKEYIECPDALNERHISCVIKDSTKKLKIKRSNRYGFHTNNSITAEERRSLLNN